MSRRMIVSKGNTEPEIRQRGYVYQKGRKKSDSWLATERGYGFFRMDVPGQTKQVEIRVVRLYIGSLAGEPKLPP